MIFPIGRYAGATQDGVHEVCRGGVTERLDALTFAAWGLAHGPLDPVLAAAVPWTRAELVRYAGLAGLSEPAEAVGGLGPHYRAGRDEPAGHRVRLGPSLRWLGSEPELVAWTLGHGLDALTDGEPWTRDAVVEHGWQLVDTDLTEAVAQLVERGLLVEVDPDGDRDTAAEFARTYRLRPLLLALGPDPSEPDTILIGTAGEPTVALSGFGHAVWRAAQDAPTLWDTCHAVVAADATVPGAQTLLPELLSELHGLLGAGVAYLDPAEVAYLGPAEGETRNADVAIH